MRGDAGDGRGIDRESLRIHKFETALSVPPTVSVEYNRNVTAMSSLHNRHGGKVTQRTNVPSESEGLALAVGCALFWCKVRDSTHSDFFSTIAFEVNRASSRATSTFSRSRATTTTTFSQREAAHTHGLRRQLQTLSCSFAPPQSFVWQRRVRSSPS